MNFDQALKLKAGDTVIVSGEAYIFDRLEDDGNTVICMHPAGFPTPLAFATQNVKTAVDHQSDVANERYFKD